MSDTKAAIRVEVLMASGRLVEVYADTIRLGDTIHIEDPTGLQLTIETKDPTE